MKRATAELPYWTARHDEIEPISRILRDGSGVVKTGEIPKGKYLLKRLSLTEDTWIAINFNSYVVKLKEGL